jgi:hypothetical protein
MAYFVIDVQVQTCLQHFNWREFSKVLGCQPSQVLQFNLCVRDRPLLCHQDFGVLDAGNRFVSYFLPIYKYLTRLSAREGFTEFRYSPCKIASQLRMEEWAIRINIDSLDYCTRCSAS